MKKLLVQFTEGTDKLYNLDNYSTITVGRLKTSVIYLQNRYISRVQCGLTLFNFDTGVH